LWREKKTLGAEFSPNRRNHVVCVEEKASLFEIYYVLAAHVQLQKPYIPPETMSFS